MTERSPAPQGRATHEPGLASRPGHSVSVPNAEAIAFALRDDGPHYVLGAAFWCAFIDPMRTKWDQPYPCHFLAFLHNGLVKPHDGRGAKLTPLGEAVRDIMARARASGMSAFGQDAEERLEAKPASPTANGGDAQPSSGDTSNE